MQVGDITDLEKKVNEIYNAIVGRGLHSNNGIINRIEELERWKRAQSKLIGIAIGLAMAAGYLLDKVINL